MSARSSTEVGSSSRMTRCPWARSSSVSALASSTIWRVAKSSSPARWRGSRSAEADLGELAAGGGIELAPAHQARAGEAPLVAEPDVLADREVGQQRLLLEHHADAVPGGVGGAAQRDRLASEQDAASVGLVDAGEDAHQRRLAGTVLADQADHLVRPHLDAHRLQRVHAGKALVDLFEGQGGDGHLTIFIRARSSDSATAAMIISPCTACWT